ncbi:hypothetical protein [Kitasatospora sp. NPDC093102]|uniref:hypothetical protein n=1 Tax=Kitasatospora sp. NPDC093102 TaxID=3155069 RepID=UPI003441F9DE
MPITTAVVGTGLAAHRARATLRHCELFTTAGDEDVPAVPGAGAVALREWNRLLGNPNIELLVIAAPPGDRIALSRAARAAGKAVLLEEGPPLSLAELDRLAEDDALLDAPVGMVLPFRAVLDLDQGLTRVPWTPVACAGLFVSEFVPRPVPPRNRRTGQPEDGGPALWPSRALLAAAGPLLDLACQLFGRPGSAHLKGAETGSAAGSVDFVSGVPLALTVTVRSAIEDFHLKVTDVDRSILLRGRELRIEDQNGLVTRTVPSHAELRLASYRETARVLRSGASVGRRSPESTRFLAECLALLRL